MEGQTKLSNKRPKCPFPINSLGFQIFTANIQTCLENPVSFHDHRLSSKEKDAER
jgi:hypothetical protein